MRVWTKAVFDIETCELIGGEWDEYTGAVAECKATDTANNQRQTELAMQQQAFQTQMQQIAELKQQVAPYVTPAGQGFLPEQQTAMQSQFLNNNAQQYQNAGQAVRAALLARGSGLGDMPASGDYTRGIASLMGAAASSQAQGVLGLQQMNAQQALQNKMNAMNLLSGNAATLTGTQGVSGSGAANALNSYITASNTGFSGSFQNAFGGALGKGLGAVASGGTAWGTGG